MLVDSGPARVVASGEVTTFFGHGLRLTLDLDDEAFVLEWVFEDGEEASVVAEELPSGRRFVCVGLDDRPGRGSSEPVPVVRVGDDVVFVHFRTTRWGRSPDRTVHYTIYRVSRSLVDRGALDV
jgi:hypothetical protein